MDECGEDEQDDYNVDDGDNDVYDTDAFVTTAMMMIVVKVTADLCMQYYRYTDTSISCSKY